VIYTYVVLCLMSFLCTAILYLTVTYNEIISYLFPCCIFIHLEAALRPQSALDLINGAEQSITVFNYQRL